MIKEKMIDQINQLQFSTASSLKTVQEAKVPKLFDLGAERRMRYSYSGFSYPIRIDNRLVFYCKNIPYRNLNKRKNNLVFIETMINLIKNNEVWPFLVFINNKFVKWSNITIIHDFKYSYLVIDNIKTTDYDSINAIYLPFSIAYNEKGIRYGSNYDIFTFNDLGILDPRGKTVISYNNTNFYYHTGTVYDTGILNVELPDIDSSYKMNELNIIAFNNGRLYPDAHIEMNAFNIFSIDKGAYIPENMMSYKAFYYKSKNKSADNIYRFKDPEELKKIIKERTLGVKPPEWFEFLETPFDFSFTRDKSYDMNVEDNISYIMNYNPLLMTDMFKGLGDIESRRFSGAEFKALDRDNEGAVMLPRTLDGRMFDNYIIVIVNGLLYKWYEGVKYFNEYIRIPILDIEDTDIVEILYFKNVDNRRIIMNMSKDDTTPNITDPTIILDKAQLFYKTPFDPAYELEEKEEIQYLVPFVFVTTPEGKRIKPSLSYYYDKDLVLAFDNQFRHRFFRIENDDTLYIDLPEDFWYCKNEHQFMCFVNQTRLNYDEFRITIPKNTRPFDDIRLYTTVPLQAGDVVDLFYVGTYMEDIVIKPSMPVTGDIIIDKSQIAYGLSKDVYMVFVNGFKIPPEHMVDVGTNYLKIINNYNTVRDVSIVKYIPDDDIINSYLQAGESVWDNTLKMIPTEILDKLLDFEGIKHTNTYDRFNGRAMYTLKTILLEIITEYWLRRRYSTGQIFVYDYDTSVFEEHKGVYALTALDANDEERIINQE